MTPTLTGQKQGQGVTTCQNTYKSKYFIVAQLFKSVTEGKVAKQFLTAAAISL